MKPVIFNAQLYDTRIKRNGGRIQFDFGIDAVEAVNEIARIATLKDMNFQVAIVYVPNKALNPGLGEQDL